ncbi:MAG: type IV pilus modification protein PilV [Gammaproteobacteria bacterium]|nr:type IV pilus modification protein PilV [Gammaproteobacteria bacterium]
MSIKSIKNNRGFTLLEALIGFLILSIGMLGIASLQAISLKAGKTSVYSSVAMMKVEELLESMRANPSVAALTAYQTAGTVDGAGTDNSCSGNKECSVAELAQDDIYWWKQNLKAGLPGAATASVTVTPAAGVSKMAEVVVTINWKERHTSDATNTTGVDKTYTITANICNASPC